MGVVSRPLTFCLLIMPNFKRTLITAALPYANGPLHIGHLAGCYLPADLYARGTVAAHPAQLHSHRRRFPQLGERALSPGLKRDVRRRLKRLPIEGLAACSI